MQHIIWKYRKGLEPKRSHACVESSDLNPYSIPKKVGILKKTQLNSPFNRVTVSLGQLIKTWCIFTWSGWSSRTEEVYPQFTLIKSCSIIFRYKINELQHKICKLYCSVLKFVHHIPTCAWNWCCASSLSCSASSACVSVPCSLDLFFWQLCSSLYVLQTLPSFTIFLFCCSLKILVGGWRAERSYASARGERKETGDTPCLRERKRRGAGLLQPVAPVLNLKRILSTVLNWWKRTVSVAHRIRAAGENCKCRL